MADSKSDAVPIIATESNDATAEATTTEASDDIAAIKATSPAGAASPSTEKGEEEAALPENGSLEKVSAAANSELAGEDTSDGAEATASAPAAAEETAATVTTADAVAADTTVAAEVDGVDAVESAAANGAPASSEANGDALDGIAKRKADDVVASNEEAAAAPEKRAKLDGAEEPASTTKEELQNGAEASEVAA